MSAGNAPPRVTMMSVLKRAVRARLSTGVIEALRSLRAELGLQRLHRSGVRGARRYAGAGSLRLHLGSGPNYKPGWVNIDLLSSDPSDLLLDLREPLPFANGSAAYIYSEHVFEHFSYPGEVNRLLAECLRVLAPGGTFDVGVPDTQQAIYDCCILRDPDKLARARELWHPPWCDLPLHQLNYHFRQGTEHKYAWDFETLSSVLAKAGFATIGQRDFDPGLDDERRMGTLHVRAHKPS
jgi:predicted SAM-dependent methyltransferase